MTRKKSYTLIIGTSGWFLFLLLAILPPHALGQSSSWVVDTARVTYYSTGNLQYDLLLAAHEDNLPVVRELLRRQVDPNTRYWDNNTPLSYAVRNGNLEMIKELVKAGADKEHAVSRGRTPLIQAARFGDVEIADFLILSGANIDARDEHGATPLFYVALYGDSVMTDMLLYFEADFTLVTKDGLDPLMAACMSGNPDVVGLLLAEGAEVNKADHEGYTALMYAVKSGSLAVLDLLLQAGAPVGQKTISGVDALGFAIRQGNLEMVERLILYGANVNTTYRVAENPLYLSERFHMENIRELLLANEAKRNKKPAYNRFSFGVPMLVNSSDVLWGGQLGLLDTKYFTRISLGYTRRIGTMPVLSYRREGYAYQFWEKRSSFFLGFEKLFRFRDLGDDSMTGVYLGGKGIFSFANYRGSTEKPFPVLIPSFNAGVRSGGRNLTVSLGYEYANYLVEPASPHRFTFGLDIFFGSGGGRYNFKKLSWLE